MPRISKAQQAEIDAANAQAMTELVADPLEAIRPYLAQAGVEDSEVLFYLYRVVDEGKRVDAFLFKCKPEDYDPERLGQQYGSGTYRMKVYVKDNDHPNGVVRAAPKFAVEMPPGFKPGLPDTPAQSAPVAPAAPALTAADIALAVTEAVRASMPPAKTFAEQLQEMKLLAEIFKPAQAASVVQVPASDPIAEVTRTIGLMKMIKELNPEPPDLENPTGLLLEGFKTITGAFANARGAQTPLPAPMPAQPAQPAALTALPANDGATVTITPTASAAGTMPAANVSTEPTGDDMGMFQKMMIGFAIADAKKGADPESDAAIFFEKADDDLLNIIIDGADATGKDWFMILCEIHPDAAAYRPWFDAFRAKVLEFDRAAQAEEAAEKSAQVDAVP